MVSYEAEAAALTFLAQAAAAEEESMRDAIYKEPTANRSGKYGHRRGGNSWCPLSRAACATRVRLPSLVSWPQNLPV